MSAFGNGKVDVYDLFEGALPSSKLVGRLRTVRLWETLGGKLPFQFGSTGKVCLDCSRPHFGRLTTSCNFLKAAVL